jgi:hypothetical protein
VGRGIDKKVEFSKFVATEIPIDEIIAFDVEFPAAKRAGFYSRGEDNAILRT